MRRQEGAARRTKSLQARRSVKAGRPPQEVGLTPGQKTVKITLKKGTLLMQATAPPRTVWGAKSRKRKKM